MNDTAHDPRRDTPSFHRNIEAITHVLGGIIQNKHAHVLEIASGSGQHVTHFGHAFPDMVFQPTEYDAASLPSIDAWSETTRNVLSARRLDITDKHWFENEIPRFDVLFCANVIHITPFTVTQALFAGAARNLKKPTGKLLLYGPYKVDGTHTSEGNIEFDLWLKEKDKSFGIRDIGEVESVARRNGFVLAKSHAMPANNFIQEFVFSEG